MNQTTSAGNASQARDDPKFDLLSSCSEQRAKDFRGTWTYQITAQESRLDYERRQPEVSHKYPRHIAVTGSGMF